MLGLSSPVGNKANSKVRVSCYAEWFLILRRGLLIVLQPTAMMIEYDNNFSGHSFDKKVWGKCIARQVYYEKIFQFLLSTFECKHQFYSGLTSLLWLWPFFFLKMLKLICLKQSLQTSKGNWKLRMDVFLKTTNQLTLRPRPIWTNYTRYSSMYNFDVNNHVNDKIK